MFNYSPPPSLLFLPLGGSQSCLCPSNLCLCTSPDLCECDPSQKSLLLVSLQLQNHTCLVCVAMYLTGPSFMSLLR